MTTSITTVASSADQKTVSEIDHALLDAMQLQADPLADHTIAAILDDWSLSSDISTETLLQQNAKQWATLAHANRLMSQWTTNGSLASWTPHLRDGSPDTSSVAHALKRYVDQARALPTWADHAQIERAEQVFMDHGVLSCLLLFCASLPQCYVLPDLSDVLHAAGQLEEHTEHRIRATAAMIFPVMMRGGLTSDEGSGVAQVLKVRLIHAMIRNLILRGTPEATVKALQQNALEAALSTLPLTLPADNKDLFQKLFAHGWNIKRDGLPCNQEELGYTLLTFHYIFVNGMRTLRIPLPSADEAAYLHTWNVMAHVLGVDTVLMPRTMETAANTFALMQARGRADEAKRPAAEDPRPKLGVALMQCMENAIPVAALRGIPSLLTKTLCGKQVVRELGIAHRASLISRLVYAIVMFIVRVIDGVVRLFIPQFSLSKMLSRAMGYQLLSQLLMSQTRPLRLPTHLLNQMNEVIDQWSSDRHAPHWLNALEDRFTGAGSWNTAKRNAHSK